MMKEALEEGMRRSGEPSESGHHEKQGSMEPMLEGVNEQSRRDVRARRQRDKGATRVKNGRPG